MNKSTKKQLQIITLIIILIGTFQISLKYYKQKSKPENIAIEFLNDLSYKNISNYLSDSDLKSLNKHNKDLSLLNLDNLSPFKYKGGTLLSESKFKADFLNKNNQIVSIFLIKDSGWKVFIDINKNYEIKSALADLKLAEQSEDEEALLAIYKNLNKLIPTIEYADKITKLEQFIKTKEELLNYKNKISIQNFKEDKGFISGLILNNGNKNISKVYAKLIVGNAKGELLWEESIIIFEQIPGSFVFGKPLISGFQKKFGLNLINKKIPSNSLINFEVLKVEFSNDKI